MRLSTRHILSVRDLSRRDVDLIVDTARSFKAISERAIKKVPPLRGKTVVNCFFEDSTRTRVSFEIAEKRLSADVVNFSAKGSAMGEKGETFVDTIRNIEAMRPDALVIRDGHAGAANVAARLTKAHVINAGDGMHEHPTQALLDLYTIMEVKGKVRGLSVALVGDIAHSRVARSDLLLFQKMGMKVWLAGPLTLKPSGIEACGVQFTSDIRKIIPDLDVLMVLRIQQERMKFHAFPSEREYARYFGISEETLKKAKEDLVIMHPGPVNRGIEISPDVIDGKRSIVLEQVTNGVAVRMALLYLLLGEGRMEQ